jgi:poly(3-hydroxybutyrate) depolymerase
LPPQSPVAIAAVWLFADQRKLYGAVPPVAVTVAAPSQLLLQVTCVVTAALALIAVAGSVIVTPTVVVQKFRSVTVTV